MTISITRRYERGEHLDEGHQATKLHAPACLALIRGGYFCSLPAEHTGPQHVAAVTDGRVIGIVDRDQPADPVDEALRTARSERDAYLAQLEEARAEHEQFRQKVTEVAGRLATEHDWCSVVDAALDELGCPPRIRECDIEVTITATRTITVRHPVPLGLDDTDEVKGLLNWTVVDAAFAAQEREEGWGTTEYEVESWEPVDDD